MVLSIISEAVKRLASFRHDRSHWVACAYREESNVERGTFDGNELERCRFLIALQYHCVAEDEEFVRFLFDQEVLARQRDSFQGCGDSLRLASYLLSRSNSPSDFWRFAEAKFANFDTLCGYDTQFLLSAGVESALSAFTASEHPLKEEVEKLLFDEHGTCRFSMEDMSEWRRQLGEYFPGCVHAESVRVWIDRSIVFQCLDEGRALLDEWELSQPNEPMSSLRDLRQALGDFTNAIEKQQVILRDAKDTWDRVSAALTLANLHMEVDQPVRAWAVIAAHSTFLGQIEGWEQVGLGRMLVKTAFDVAKAVPIHAASQAAFDWACDHESQLQSTTLEILQTAVRAADAIGDERRSARFREAAVAEQARIAEMMKQIP